MKRRNAAACLLAGLALFALFAGPALATTALAPASVEQLTAHADLALEGRVVSIHSFREGQQIFTEIEVEVLEAVKGRAAGTVTLRLYGGVVDGKRTRVIGAPCIGTGEEVFLFLAANGPRSYDVVNLAEGKFSIVRGAEMRGGGEVRRDLREIAFIDPAMPAIPSTLADLKAAVRVAAKAIAAPRGR